MTTITKVTSGDSTTSNRVGDVQNLTGVLLAGFGAVAGFIGLNSDEVDDVLRNNAPIASLVALVLLAGILAAVFSAFTSSNLLFRRDEPDDADETEICGPGIPYGIVGGGVLCLAGLVVLVVLATPAGSSAWTLSRWILLGTGAVLLLAGLVFGTAAALGASWTTPVKDATPRPSLQLSAILVAVVLVATATYGAMRLETRSQLTHSVEVASVLKSSGTNYDLSLMVHASKVPSADYVGYTVFGLPSAVHFAAECSTAKKNFHAWVIAYEMKHHLKSIQFNRAACTSDPCDYARFDLQLSCLTISSGIIPPNASGGVDEQLNVPLKAGLYQLVDVRSSYCMPQGCTNTNNGGTRQDIVLSP